MKTLSKSKGLEMCRFFVVVCAFILIAGTGAQADQVTIEPSKDTTLYEDTLGTVSNGAGDNFFAGNNAIGLARRGLLAFDIATAMPASAVIDSACLVLHLSRTNTFLAKAELVALFRVLNDWGEAGSDPVLEEGSGALADSGDATWIHTFFDTTAAQFWTTPGGDFSATVSDTQMVDTLSTLDSLNFYKWSSAQLTADVQSMLDVPANNFGWLLRGNEAELVTTKRFDSREDTIAVFRPALQIFFTNPPTAVGDDVVTPKRFALRVNFPNPFNPQTTIAYSVDRRQALTLTIHDVLGRRIRTLVNRVTVAGDHRVDWNGRDAAGNAVASGIYFARLKSAERVDTRKLVLLK